MLVAHHLARAVLPRYASRFGRHDFTLPQLFACLVVREHQRKSYREAEALLRDAPHWCRGIGMRRVPDHNTLCRAFHALRLGRRAPQLLDRLARWFAVARQLGPAVAIDSTLYDTHHRSRHYERRLRHHASRDRTTADARRSRAARRSPKLCVGVCTRSHLVLAARARTGMGSDCRDFGPLLSDARRRHPRLRVALADAGYDSEDNHRIARLDVGVRSPIKAGAGRPSDKPPAGRYRRLMTRQLGGSQRGRAYAQRSQAETVNSMLKRNLGDALRAKSPAARRHEQLLRVITHNLSLL